MLVVLHDGRRLWAALHLSLLHHHDDDGDDDDASDDDGDASSTDEMST